MDYQSSLAWVQALTMDSMSNSRFSIEELEELSFVLHVMFLIHGIEKSRSETQELWSLIQDRINVLGVDLGNTQDTVQS